MERIRLQFACRRQESARERDICLGSFSSPKKACKGITDDANSTKTWEELALPWEEEKLEMGARSA